MSHPILEHDIVLELTLELAGADLSLTDLRFVELDSALRTWKRAADLKEIVVTVAGPIMTFSAELIDGRKTDGTIDFTTNPNDPAVLTVMTGAGWTISELQHSDRVRNAIIEIYTRNDLTSLTVEFV